MIYGKSNKTLKGNTCVFFEIFLFSFRQIIENLKSLKIAFKSIDKTCYLLLLINATK